MPRNIGQLQHTPAGLSNRHSLVCQCLLKLSVCSTSRLMAPKSLSCSRWNAIGFVCCMCVFGLKATSCFCLQGYKLKDTSQAHQTCTISNRVEFVDAGLHALETGKQAQKILQQIIARTSVDTQDLFRPFTTL